MEIRMDAERVAVRGALSLFPLFWDERCDGDYVTGPEAAAAGLFEVGERSAGAVVPELEIDNRATAPLLLVEGEVLVGTKQNRTLNVTVLCAPSARTVIPVSCVEQGRWSSAKRAGRGRFHASAKLRAVKASSVLRSVKAGRGRRSDQSSVWHQVDALAAKLDARSATSSLDEVQSRVGARLDRVVAALRPVEGQCGVLAMIGDEPLALDLFDRPSTLAAYWPSLVGGYASDTIGERPGRAPAAAALAFVDALCGAAAKETPAAGCGRECWLEAEGLAAVALRWNGGTVHLSAFATA